MRSDAEGSPGETGWARSLLQRPPVRTWRALPSRSDDSTTHRPHLGKRVRAWVIKQLKQRGELMVYRTAGLPIVLRTLFEPDVGTPTATIRAAYARRFWKAEPIEYLDLAIAILLWPLVVGAAAIWMTCRNGSIVAARSGRSRPGQVRDQLWLAVTRGILPPWYYILDFHDRSRMTRAASYLSRCETKRGVYELLNERHETPSPLSDKAEFAVYCETRQIPTIPVLVVARGGNLVGEYSDRLPSIDLFVKPVRGQGGKGAERWNCLEPDLFERVGTGQRLRGEALLQRLKEESHWIPRLVQPRVVNHPAIADLSNGALATVRALSCMDASIRPELVGTVLRMAVGSNKVVDNLHSGGIMANVDIRTGRLEYATDLGMDAHLGWVDRHPDTGARIEGRIMPMWDDVCALVIRTHSAFGDRILVGWDVGILPDGPCLVEGNRGPDVDGMQRAARRPLGTGRFGELLAYHLKYGACPSHTL